MNEPKISYAGSWKYSNNNKHDIVTFYSPILLGNEKKLGFVLAGWAYAGWENDSFYQTKIAILDQRSDGSFQINTDKYVSDPTINGTGSINVADFDGDSRQDVLLVSHNESPLIDKSSSVFMALENGGFQKTILNDLSQAHSAQLSNWDGAKVVVTAGYGKLDPYFKFDSISSGLKVHQWRHEEWNGQIIKRFYASTAVINDLDNDGDGEIVLGDVLAAPGINYDHTLSSPRYLAVYQLQGGDLADAPSFKSEFYFDRNPGYRSFNPENPDRLTHNYRLWTEDLNHDGLQDIIAGSSLWVQNIGHQRSKLEIFQNIGNLQFQDASNVLASDYSELTESVDYSMQMIDIDSSGIKTFFLADGWATSYNNNPNYILLNDGTGKLHNALHDEFMILGHQVKDFLQRNNLAVNDFFKAPKFIAYVNPSGTIDFIAQWVGDGQGSIPLINVQVGYNPATDFTKSILITDRNQSKLIRTWAGNDTFYDNNSNSGTTINGGNGIDQCFYSSQFEKYNIRLSNNNSYEVIYRQSGYADQLFNVERINFADLSIALDASGVAGQTYRIYKAAFNRTPDTGGLGYWIAQMDKGMDVVSVAARFIDSSEFRSIYGQNPSNAEFLTRVYSNVLARSPDAAGLDWWVNEMKTNPSKTWQKVLADFSESIENQANVASLIANGIEYVPWTG